MSIQSEIKQRKPFSSKGEEAAVALMRTADLIRRSITSVLDPHGLSVQQYNVLRILRGAGDEGLPTLEIAERAIEQAPGITRLVDTLERKKFVTRKRSSNDRRCVYCRITRAGLDLLRQLDAPMSEAADLAVHHVKPKELTQLIESLDRMRKGLNNMLFNDKEES